MGRHNAEFRGHWTDVPLELETGIRQSGLYGVVVTLALDLGSPPVVLRAAADTDNERLRALFEQHDALVVLRIDAGRVTLRLRPGTGPRAIEAMLDAVFTLARVSREAGPYR